MMSAKLKYVITGCLIIITISAFSQKTPDNNILKGVAFSKMQLHDSVIYYLGKAGDGMDAFPETYINYGIALISKGQNLIAMQEFQKAEKKEPGLASFWIAKLYAGTGDLENSVKYLEINLKSKYKEQESKILLDPDFQKFENEDIWKEFWKNSASSSTLETILFEAEYKLRSGDYTEALEIINGGLKRGLRRALLHAKRADVYLAMNNHRMASNDLSKAIEGDRQNPELYTKRAYASIKLERYKQSLADFDQALKLDPLNLQLYKGRADANNGNGFYEPAISDISYYLTYFPQDHEAWYQTGMIHMSNQKFLKALESFNKALALDRNKAEYYSARGETYMQTKTYRYAWNDFSMALDINPVNPKVYLSKGIAAVNLGNIKDACFSFNMAKRQGAYEADEYISRYCGGTDGEL